MAKKWLKSKVMNNGIEIILKNGEYHIFKSKKIDDWFSVHLCEKCKSEVNCVYDIENGRFQNIRYKCKHCGHDVSINIKDVKEIKSI